MSCGCMNHSGKNMAGHHTDQTEDTGGNAGRVSSSAINILNERYARGELSREEYLKMRGDIAAK